MKSPVPLIVSFMGLILKTLIEQLNISKAKYRKMHNSVLSDASNIVRGFLGD